MDMEFNHHLVNIQQESPSPTEILEALEYDGNLLFYLEEQTLEMCIVADKQNHSSNRYVNDVIKKNKEYRKHIMERKLKEI